MSIAQLSVACEGELHPEDSEALRAFRSDPVNLPWVIFRAAFRASHVENLPQRARSLLAALARTVDAERPHAAIFARRELLTGRAMQSMRTFYRSLDDLETAGLIERRPQSRYVEAGLFGRAYLHLTEKAALLLGLSEPRAPESQQAEPASLKRPSATMAHGAIYKDLYPVSYQKRQPGQVPVDLQRLRSLGFLDFLIFKLMREAREHGKRLSDVVEVTWDHLKLAKAPINYLRSLLRGSADFAHEVRRRHQASAEVQRTFERRNVAEEVARKCAGQTFVDPTGNTRYIVDADGESLTVLNLNEGVARSAAGWKEKFAEARVKGFIRPDSSITGSPPRPMTSLKTPQPLTKRPPVTQSVRDHVASLRAILKGRSAAIVTT